MDCLFCSIIAGDIPSKNVYEDDHAYAFLDINPWQSGHTLVVPRRHSVDALDSDEVLAEVGPAVARVGRLLKERLDADAVNIVANAGAASGQGRSSTPIVHVIPRWASNPGIANMKTEVTDDLDDVWRRIVRAE